MEAILYEDGNRLHGMRDVRVEVSGTGCPVVVRVLHQDESQNQLMRQINSGRSQS